MKNTISWIVIALVVIIGGWLFLTPSTPTEKGPIKIGVVIPLTGPNSHTIGNPIKNSLKMLVNKYNVKNSEHKLKLIFEDSKMKPAEGVNVVNKLLAEGVNYFFVFGTSINLAIQPITEPKNKLDFAFGIPKLLSENNKNTIRLFFNMGQGIEKIGELLQKNNPKKIAMLVQRGEAWERQISTIKNLFPKKSKLGKIEYYNMGTTDYRTQITKLKESNPDVTILLGYGAFWGPLFKQIKEQNFKTKIIANLDMLDVPRNLNVEIYNGTEFVVPEMVFGTTQKTKDYTNEYRSIYKDDPTHVGASAYDSLNLLIKCFKENNYEENNTKTCVKKDRVFKGALGTITLKDRDSTYNLDLAIWKNGSIIKL